MSTPTCTRGWRSRRARRASARLRIGSRRSPKQKEVMRTVFKKPWTVYPTEMIKRENLLPLESYARERDAFRAKVIEHKKHRTVRLGQHLTLLFEDELTLRYQVQEMLRVERIFEEDGIRQELDAYNPLVPDGGNWKATMLIEYLDADERRRMLAKLKGIERRVWVQVEGC